MTSKPLQGSGARSIFIILAIALIFSLFAATALSAPGYIAGDVNGDGLINVKDVVLVMKHTLEMQFPPLTEDQLRAADINGDGVVNVSDAVEIMKIALGLTDSVPMPITSLEDAVVRVPIGTALADLNLPATVQAHFAGGVKRSLSVKWEQVSKPAYNPFVFDEYVFRGELTNLPSGVKNPADLKPRARVSFLLRDPWPFPGPGPGQYTLTLRTAPEEGIADLVGAGIYSANEIVRISATPRGLGIEFDRWTDERDGSLFSRENPHTFNMPDRSLVLVANFRPLVADWPIELEDQILVGGGLADLWLVTLTVKPEYANQVTRITVKGVDANQDPVNPRRWEVLLEQDTRPTRDELIGRITVATTMPGQIDVIDMTRTAAFFVGALYDVVVRVYIKSGEIADEVTLATDGDIKVVDRPSPTREYWRFYIDNINRDDQIQVNASNIIGVQTRTITVQ